MKKVFLVFSTLLLFASFAFGQSGDPTVKIMTIPSVTGETVDVPIKAMNFSNVGSFTFEIQFDDSQLTFLEVANSSAAILGGSNLQYNVVSSGRGSADNVNATASLFILWEYDTDDETSVLDITDSQIFDIKFTALTDDQAPITGVSSSSIVEPPDASTETNVTFIDGMAAGPGVIIASPNGGETWHVDAEETVEWYSAGISTIDIDVSTDDGTTWTSIATGVDHTLKMYDYTVAVDPSVEALVRATTTDVDTWISTDQSDEVFNIFNLGANSHTITVGTISGDSGESVSVPIYGANFTEVASFTVVLEFDPACAQFTGVDNVNSIIDAPNGTYSVTPVADANAMGVAVFLWEYNVESGSPIDITMNPALLFDAQFDMQTDGACDITLGDGTILEDEDANLITDSKLVNGGVNTPLVKIGTAEGEAVGAGALVWLDVTARNLSDVMSFTFNIAYDPEELDFVSAELVSDTLASNGAVAVTEAVDGELTVTFDGSAAGRGAAGSVEEAFTMLDGRLMSLRFRHNAGFSSNVVFTGATMTDSNGDPIAVNTWDGGVNISPLPVELTTFESSVSGNTVSLNWITASETNNYGFEIERAVDAGEYQRVGFVAGSGNSSSPKAYSFSDEVDGFGTYLYRLKQIDIDGAFMYSSVLEVSVSAVPAEYALNQNYPNPFNPSTTISFQIPEAGNVNLSVYNLLGQEVELLVSGFMEAGYHDVNFTANNLSTGIYLYRIESGNFVQIKKMTLIK